MVWINEATYLSTWRDNDELNISENEGNVTRSFFILVMVNLSTLRASAAHHETLLGSIEKL